MPVQGKSTGDTPLMKQYNKVKSKHPDAVLLFRVGDFYETFGEDAVKTAEILGITLTRRSNGAASGVELAGFPFHALDTYLPRLVRAGQKVAICEQLEDPKLAKGIVKRGITELITPGVTLHDQVLEHKENNFLACLHVEKGQMGVAFLDVSTGEFFVAQGVREQMDHWMSSFSPKEVLLERKNQGLFREAFGLRYYVTFLEDWAFVPETAYEKLLKQLGTLNLKGFGIEKDHSGIVAAGAILQYLEITRHDRLSHIVKIIPLHESSCAGLDKFSVRNLEILFPGSEGGVPLVTILDKTRSVMGSRLLKRWLIMPLKDTARIEKRQLVVAFLLGDSSLREALSEQMSITGDLERLAGKVAAGKVTPREMNQIRISLQAVESIRKLCLEEDQTPLVSIGKDIDDCSDLARHIAKVLREDVPSQVGKGHVIAPGVSAELDELREILISGKDYLLHLQKREIERTGISSLKVSFNNVFGYYIEVRNTHRDKVPPDWIRKQTLVSAERYITEELKEYESKILGAEDKILALEIQLYEALIAETLPYLPRMLHSAHEIARLDVLLSFAETAGNNNYCRPVVVEGKAIEIYQGRHPVIEATLPPDNPYIPNDVVLNSDQQQIMIITGPNMSGKSALLRQTALIVLMAQTGSYVPAARARIGVVDKIFTRVGASDNISRGESTFMVEMTESAGILNNITSRSLVLLDEIGRGTSTYDGISIAWSMVEFLHEHPSARAKTLFATHYHELNEMASHFPRIKNFHISIKELDHKIVFLRQLVPGGSEHSFGIHVARMAGMPPSVVQRASEILLQLENSREDTGGLISRPLSDLASRREGYQLTLFQLDDPVLRQIRDELLALDINALTPLEALNKLNEIRRMVGLKQNR